MEQKLKAITNRYYTFVDNQVLTKDQLNAFIHYFDDQVRLSRLFLHGVGIASGFDLKFSDSGGNTTLTLSQGVGLTTDGDLLTLRGKIPPSEDESVDLTEIVYTHFRKFEDKNARYDFFERTIAENTKEPLEMWEILPGKTGNEKELSKLPGIKEKVALLYLESFAKKGDLCTAIDCDNQGVEQVARLRVLLVSQEDATFIAEADPVFIRHNLAEKYPAAQEIKTPRVQLSAATGADSLKKCFRGAVFASVLKNLKDGYDFIFEVFGRPSPIAEKTDQLFNYILSGAPVPADFQYRHELLDDLIHTYNEIIRLFLHVNAEPHPMIHSFPKHLMLGKISESGPMKTYRHRFYRSPLSEPACSNREKILSLLNRAELMVKSYQPVQKGEIRITPSGLSGLTGEKAIPSYYQVNDSFLDNWCYEQTSNLMQKSNLSYHVDALADKPEVRQPLRFNLDAYDLYRIEGQLGAGAMESCEKIVSLRNRYGLHFDCKILDFGKREDDFQKFIRRHPSLCHKGGVSPGGTFLLIAEDDTVMADLCLPYTIPEESAEQSCCSLMECTYPWISSLKYLNNLARSTKGTQSRNRPMPQSYLLQIIEYRINRTPLISRTVNLTIPLEDIFFRRMHAITDALNNRFPHGVVFDFNESQKRFVITRAREDTYTLRLRDATLANNNPVYTYSNQGMFRDNKVFRPGAMHCRDLKPYIPSFYAKLHEKIAPVGKDDDYGAFNDKWKKWNILKNRLVTNPDIRSYGLTRMITSADQLPGEIRTRLGELKNDFQKATDTQLRFMLDGDWVTGEWVNKTMLDHYRAHKKDTHDDIVLFLNLRKYLHGETGVTRLSVYITNQAYTPDFDPVIEKYKDFADIYFGVPRGEHAIRV